MKHFGRCAFSVALLFALVSQGSAQNVTGTITGIVTDSSGAVVPNAKATARNTGTAAMFTGATDADGTYWLRTLPVGSYEVTVEAGGFQKFEAKDIRLQVNEISRIDVRLT